MMMGKIDRNYKPDIICSGQMPWKIVCGKCFRVYMLCKKTKLILLTSLLWLFQS